MSIRDRAARPTVLAVMVELTARADSGARLHTRLLVEELAAQTDLTVLVVGPEPSDAVGSSIATRWHRVDNGRKAGRALEFGAAFLHGQHVVLHRALRQGATDALAASAHKIKPELIVLQRPLYGPLIHSARRFAPTIVDADESTTKMMRLIASSPPSQAARARALMEWLVFSRLERSLASADEVWVTSDVEAGELRRTAAGIRTRTVPNVIDSPSFEGVRARPLGAARAAYVGTYDYAPNAAAARWIIEEMAPVFAARGLGTVELIGRKPTARMRRLAARHANVHVTGEVDDPWSTVRAAGILIVPLRTGAGTRWKVLEAAAAEVPIVSTRFGVQGLGFTPGEHFLVAETANEYADAVERIRSDPDVRQTLTAQARHRVETRFSRARRPQQCGRGSYGSRTGHPRCGHVNAVVPSRSTSVTCHTSES